MPLPSPLRPRCAAAPRATAPRALAALAALLGAGCGPGLQPAPRPSPSGPVELPPAAPLPAAAAFAYGTGRGVAIVESRAAIDVADDSTAASDTVVTTARVRWELGPDAGGDRALRAVVDSFAVRAGSRVPAGAAVPLPVRVTGRASGGQVRLDPPALPPSPLPPPVAPATPSAAPGPPSDCAGPAATVLGSVRELFPRLPGPLARGARWADTVTTVTCPGGVRLVSTTVHRYQVAGETERAGRRLVRVERTSDLVVRGEGEQARERVTADGRGTARATLHVDPAAGRLVDLAGDSTLELTFTGAGRVQRVVQRGTVVVREGQ